MSRIGAGTDCGKTHHHCLVLDSEGDTLLSRRVANDEPELLKLIGDVLDLADGGRTTWALDVTGGEPAARPADRPVGRPWPGARPHPRYRGQPGHRQLPGRMFPALERVLDLGDVGPLVLPAGYQTPAAIRRAGSRRLTAWLRNRKVCNAAALAEKAIAKMVHTLAKAVMALNEKTAETDKLIEGRFRDHELAEVIESLPGIGTILGAEFLTAVGGSLDAFPTANRLAAFAGVAPAPRDSGQVSGNDHRPTRYHRPLQRVFYISALVSVQRDPNSRKFYDRKRAGKRFQDRRIAELEARIVDRLG